MRVNYKNWIPLQWIKNGKIERILCCDRSDVNFLSDHDWILDCAAKAFSYNVEIFSGGVHVVKESFYEAVVDSEERLFNVFSEHVQAGSVRRISIVFIYRKVITFFCHEIPEGGNDLYGSKTTLLMFRQDGSPCLFFVEDRDILPEGTLLWVTGLYVPYKTENRDNESKKVLLGIFRTILGIDMFKRFANVETIYVDAKKKVVNHREKVLNETDVPIILLDSTWFRNIIRNEGFGVRGHFRMQPKKINGENTHELIYIAPFEKHGYNRRAGKDIHQNESAQP